MSRKESIGSFLLFPLGKIFYLISVSWFTKLYTTELLFLSIYFKCIFLCRLFHSILHSKSLADFDSKYCYQQAKNLLAEHKMELIELAELLLSKEVVFKEEIEKILGKRTFNQPPKLPV